MSRHAHGRRCGCRLVGRHAAPAFSHVGWNDGGDDAAQRRPNDSDLRRRQPEPSPARAALRSGRHFRGWLRRDLVRIQRACCRRTMDSPPAGASLTGDGQQQRLAWRPSPHRRRHIPIYPAQAHLPGALPRPARIHHDALAGRRRRRVPDGPGARPLLHRLLLGPDGIALRRRRHEHPLDRRAFLARRPGKTGSARPLAQRHHRRDSDRLGRMADRRLFPLATRWRTFWEGDSVDRCGTELGWRSPLFRSIETVRVVKKKMPPSRSSMKRDAAAAELALKAHVLASDPEILAEMTDGDRAMEEIADAVNLTEAPEDAICGLVIDLLQYCEREKIDWNEDVMSRAWEHLRRERTFEVQEQ